MRLRGMQGCEVQGCEVRACEVRACEVRACEVRACEVRACEVRPMRCGQVRCGCGVDSEVWVWTCEVWTSEVDGAKQFLLQCNGVLSRSNVTFSYQEHSILHTKQSLFCINAALFTQVPRVASKSIFSRIRNGLSSTLSMHTHTHTHTHTHSITMVKAWT